MPPDINDLKQTLKKQGELLEENNRMLQRLGRYQKATFFFAMIWYALLVGLPFALYYYVIGPYVEALGFDMANLREYPGYSQFESFFGLRSGGEGN